MSKQVNTFEHFDVEGITYKVKSLGLLEISAMSVTFYRAHRRRELKAEARDFFGDDAKAYTDFINEQRKLFPEGEELANQAVMFAETGDCQAEFCAYALNRFNRQQLPTLEKATEVYDKLNYDDQELMFRHIFGLMADVVYAEVEDDEPGKTEAPEAE